MKRFSLLGVTNRAVVEYLRLVRGVDIAAVRAEILDIIGPALETGASKVSINGNVYFLSPEEGTVISVSPGDRPSSNALAGKAAKGKRVRMRDPNSPAERSRQERRASRYTRSKR